MEFDSQLGVFSSDGRLIQVEYAQNASLQGAITVIQKTAKTIKVAYDNRQSNSLHIPLPKIHDVDGERGIRILFSGLKPDSLLVIEEAIFICRNYKYSNDEDISLSMLAAKIGEYKQQYTTSHVYRPLGLRTVLLGFEEGEPRIFIIETDGNFSEYNSCAIGQKNDIVTSYLEEKNGKCDIFEALAEVMQKDVKQVKGLELTETGINPIPEDVIKSIFENK